MQYHALFFRKLGKMSQNVSSAAVVIGALVADLFLFCYERDFMMSLSDDKQADVIDAFNTTSRYLDDILNINNVYFENMVTLQSSNLIKQMPLIPKPHF